MTLRTLALLTAGTAIALVMCPDAHAWGACHAGYTHVGPGGVYHCGATAVHGPYGSYGGYHYGGASYGGYHYGGAYGGYHYGGAAYGGTYHYSGGYGACGYAGFHYGGTYGAYHAGVYHAW